MFRIFHRRINKCNISLQYCKEALEQLVQFDESWRRSAVIWPIWLN